ncbi:unnamed protein product [Paramecium primaurelia]|uniref:Isochorismatase-like domain-containing protein n=1 Tax=Paramecium primaurelia TaxID=5886 RepID=A0A8S1M5N6_PARPR|nr:unnamed protein product [Paramecium primaurelia]
MNSLDKEKVLFFCCDIQDVFNNEANQKNYNCLQVIECACLMNEFAKVFDIPIIVSEQNPKVFGSTVQQLKNTFTQNTHFYEKFTFTMLSDKGLEILKQYPNRNQVVIYGLETHICVQQTCLDLIKLGYQVYILTDGTSSSKPLYRSTAYERLKQCNVYLETSQSVMYTLMQTSQNEKFRDVLKLIKKYQFQNIFPSL